MSDEENSKEETNPEKNQYSGSFAHLDQYGCGSDVTWPMKLGVRDDEINTQKKPEMGIIGDPKGFPCPVCLGRRI